VKHTISIFLHVTLSAAHTLHFIDLLLQLFPFVGILPEFKIIKGLKQIKKEQIEVVLPGIQHPAAFSQYK
jgi:hypothetical protein